MESAPVFQIPTSLEQLAKRPKKTTPEVLEQVTQMKDQSPQILTGCWVDENREILAVYFGRGERPKLHEGGGESEGDAKVRTTLHFPRALTYLFCRINLPANITAMPHERRNWTRRATWLTPR